jgi:hypothetical protein
VKKYINYSVATQGDPTADRVAKSPTDGIYKRHSNIETDDRYAWTDIYGMTWAIYIKDHPLVYKQRQYDADSMTTTEEVELHLIIKGTTPRAINLTALTTDELDAMQAILNLAIDTARPHVTARDQQAKKENEDDGTAFKRLYRAVPGLFVRPRKVVGNLQSLWAGPEDVSRLVRSVFSLAYSGGVARTEMAQRVPKGGLSQNDGATPDEPEVIRKAQQPRSVAGLLPTFPRPPDAPPHS